MAPTPKFPVRIILKGTDGVSGLLKRIGSKVGGVAGRIAKTTAGISAGLATAGVVAGAALLKITNATAAAGDEAAKTAKRLGLPVEALQELRFAADRAGIQSSVLDMAMQRFGRRAAEAAMGTGEARDALRQLGIQLTNADGTMRSADDLLGDVADSLSKVESPLVRNALAMRLFDSEGVKMVQLLDEGSDGIAALRDEARELGLVLSVEAAAASEEFTDRQTDMKAALSGVRNTIGAALIPVVSRLTERFTTFLVGNRGAIDALVERFAKWLPEAVEESKQILEELLRVLQPAFDLFRALSDRMGPLRAGLMLVGTALAATVVPALVLATAAVVKFTIALASNPIGLVAVAVSLLVVGLALLSARMLAAGFTFKEQWMIIKIAVASALDFIAEKVRKVTDSLPDWMVDVLRFTGPASAGLIALAERQESQGSFAAPLRNELLVTRGARLAAEEQGRQEAARVEVAFDNLPAGARVRQTDGPDVLDLSTQMGFSLGGGF